MQYENEIDLSTYHDDRPTDPVLSPFIVALAHETADYLWDNITAVDRMGRTIDVTIEDHPNSVGNAYIRGLLSQGYALVGFSAHYTKDDGVDRLHFEEIEHDDDSFQPFGEDILATHSAKERLADLGLTYLLFDEHQ